MRNAIIAIIAVVLTAAAAIALSPSEHGVICQSLCGKADAEAQAE